jgi:hypothetical protein
MHHLQGVEVPDNDIGLKYMLSAPVIRISHLFELIGSAIQICHNSGKCKIVTCAAKFKKLQLTWKPMCVFWPEAMYLPVLLTWTTETSLSWPYKNIS